MYKKLSKNEENQNNYYFTILKKIITIHFKIDNMDNLC